MTQNKETPAMFRNLALAMIVALGLMGCNAMPGSSPSLSSEKYEQDRQAILGMVGEFHVDFQFNERLAIRDGYEIDEPYHSGGTELIIVLHDEPGLVELQHILLVWMTEDEAHLVKHWRQRWEYEQEDIYEFTGRKTWEAAVTDADQRGGTWTQSVYQVDDAPRYWGVGRWVHADGVSTWTSNTTPRPLPRRESSRRNDYEILMGVNTHIVTAQGWLHHQDNYKYDLDSADSPVISLEQGVNTYTRTTEVDFAQAREYWEKTHVYWSQVRAAWDEVYERREQVWLDAKVPGDPRFVYIFDMADEYWGDAECGDVKGRVLAVIDRFSTPAEGQQAHVGATQEAR